MAFNFRKIDKPAAGAGAAKTGSRFAYLAWTQDLVSFPSTDANGVMLVGSPVFKPNKGLIPVYITTSSKEYSYESAGEQDSRSHKVKFIGSHPGSEREALEFATNMLDESFIVFIPGCTNDENVLVLGRPCEPLIFKSSHKGGKDGNKFEFTFEQEVGSKSVYLLYNGPLDLAEAFYDLVEFGNAVTSLSSIQKVNKAGSVKTFTATTLTGLEQKQVTFIGQETDPSKAGVINEVTTGEVFILLKNGLQWKAMDGANITFEVFKLGTKVALIERWRS